jgi:hypothetical protein
MSNRVRLVSLVKLAVLAACLGVVVQAQQNPHSSPTVHNKPSIANFSFQLRDGTTGYAVPGVVRFSRTQLSARDCHWSPSAPEPPKVPLLERKADDLGKVELQITPGCYAFEVTAPGYKPMTLWYEVAAGKNSGYHCCTLDPIEEPEDLKRVGSLARPGFAAAVGYVLDATTLRPIAGAEIREKNNGAVATTNARGFYALQTPFKSEPGDPCPNMLDFFFVRASGYKEFVGRRVSLNDNDVIVGLSFELEPGTGTIQDKPEPDAWDPTAPITQTQAQNASTPAWWDVKPPRRSQRKPTEEIKKWEALAPEIEKTLRPLQEDCGGNYPIHATIFDAAKFPDNGAEVALVDACPEGAYTDLILAMHLEHGKPVLSNSRQTRGRLTTLDFASGSSVMNTAAVRLVPEDKAIYGIEYSTDGCTHLMRCRVDAYVWNAETHTFRSDPALTRQGTQGYCRSLQQGLLDSYRNAATGSTPPK